MKRLIRPLLLLALVFATVMARAEVEFTGILVTPQQTLFTLRENASAGSGWCQLGQTFAGYELTAYDPKGDTLTLTKNGIKTLVHLTDAKVKSARFEITGTFTLSAGEKLDVVRATLTFGEETVFPLKDGLVFRLKPESRPDGNILYRAVFERPRPDGTIERLAAPGVIALPGQKFSIAVGDLGFSFTPQPP